MNPFLARTFAWWNGPVTAAGALYPLALMTLIFLVSSIPASNEVVDRPLVALLMWVPPSLQNTLHIPLYALLAMLINRALRAWSLPVIVAGLMAFTIASVYGLLDEWHQLTVPGRYASATDVALNMIGAAMGIWLHARIVRTSASRIPE